MAVGMFILSQKRRESLAVLFITLCVLQIIIGCGMTGSSFYVIIAVAPILHAEKSEVNFVFVVTGIYGTHVIFHWIIGINISQKCLKQASRRSTSNLFIIWTCMGTNTILQLLILSHFAKKMNRYISRSLKQSITNGMSQYLQDITWKETIDKLQYDNECCGLASYEDWHEVKWLTKYHVDVNSEIVKELRTSNEVLTLPITPWSCCKTEFPMQCLHDPLQQAEYTHIWVDEPNVVTDSINTKGCLDILRKPIDWVVKVFVVSSSILCIFHVVLFIVSRILYTSARNAILLGKPEGIAPGWIFGRGDCGYSGGKSVIEIMEAHLDFTTDPETTEDEKEEPGGSKKQFKSFKAIPSSNFFKRQISSFKSKKVRTQEPEERTEELNLSGEENTPLIERVNEKKSKTTQETSENTSNRSVAVNSSKKDMSRRKSPTETIKATRSRDQSTKTEEIKETDSKSIQKPPRSKKSTKIEEFTKKQPDIKEVSEKSKSTVSSSSRKKKKSPVTKGPSSGEETGTNSVAEEIKRLQQ